MMYEKRVSQIEIHSRALVWEKETIPQIGVRVAGL